MDIAKIKSYFNQYFVEVLKTQYADFKGRVNRPQYWYFTLFAFIISIPLGIIDAILFGSQVLTLIFSLAIFVPSIGLGIRRLHDLGKSGWLYLVVLIPVVGPIGLLVLFCLKGEDKKNQFGNVVKA